MASIAETITRICDDISRPESEMAAVAQREILTAITFYESKRLTFNERTLVVTLSQTSDYAYSFLVKNDTDVEDIIAIDDPIKALYSNREDTIWLEPWRDLYALDQLGVSTTVPSCWSHWNNTVRFYPAPNNDLVVTIQAHVRLTTLLSASGLPTTNAWLTDGEELIRNRATRMVWTKKLMDMEMGSVYQTLETEAYARMMQAAGARHLTGRLAANF
jgi:hypothetical protein